MSKRRTKAQKQQARLKHQATTTDQFMVAQTSLEQIKTLNAATTPTAQLPTTTLGKASVTASLPTAAIQSVWRFDHRLIYQDLLKTLLVSALIVGILLLIYSVSF